MDLQIFVSSQLRRRTLKEERELVRKVIEEKCPGFVSRAWEHDGPAGSQCPMDYCLTEVERSYGLVLIVSREFTQNTQAEFERAINKDIHVFPFFKKGCQRGASLAFRNSLHPAPSYRVYRNLAELESHLIMSFEHLIKDACQKYKPKSINISIGSGKL